MRALRAQDGDIIVGWLLRLVLGVAALAVVLFEVGAVVYAHLDADDAAGEVARAAAVAYGASGSLSAAEDAALDVADTRGVTLVTFEREATTLVVQVERTPGTLLVHRIPTLAAWSTRVGERSVDLGS